MERSSKQISTLLLILALGTFLVFQVGSGSAQVSSDPANPRTINVNGRGGSMQPG